MPTLLTGMVVFIYEWPGTVHGLHYTTPPGCYKTCNRTYFSNITARSAVDLASTRTRSNPAAPCSPAQHDSASFHG